MIVSPAVEQLRCENSAAVQVGYISISACRFEKYGIFPNFCSDYSVQVCYKLSLFRNGFNLSLRYFFFFLQWMTSVDVFVYMTLFCFGKADLYVKNRKEKKKKKKERKRLKKSKNVVQISMSFLHFSPRIKRTFIENIFPPMIN